MITAFDAEKINGSILPPDENAMAAARERWDQTAKPLGSLGKLEDAVVKLAGIMRDPFPVIDKRAVIVLCADNGVLAQGVAMTPGEITAVMAGFIARHRSAVCIMAKQANAEIIPVDMGMFSTVDEPSLLLRRLGNGTADMTQGPAMSRAAAEKAVLTGMELAASCKEKGIQILATGEMGIGNTTSSSAVASVLLKKAPEEMTGRGVGLTDEGLQRKKQAIETAIKINSPDPHDALDVLHKVGGFDIAAMCGVFIGGAVCGIPVIVDGFISSAAALAAQRLCPACAPYMLASHASAEPAAAELSRALRLDPVIHGDMRLGEGTGAVAMLPLLDMALAVYKELFTYADLGM